MFITQNLLLTHRSHVHYTKPPEVLPSLLNDLPLLVSLSPVSILFLYYFCLSTIVCVAPCLLSPAATNSCVVFYLVIYYNKTYTVYIFIYGNHVSDSSLNGPVCPYWASLICILTISLGETPRVA